MHQTPEWNIQKLVQANSVWIKSHKVDLSTMEESSWIWIFLSLSYLSVTFLRYYNSQENIEKRCTLKFQKDFKIPLETASEEWFLILDLADNNYLKFMRIPQF